MDDIRRFDRIMIAPEEREKRMVTTTYYMLRNNGGYYWPLIYFPLLSYIWSSLPPAIQIIASVAGAFGVLALIVFAIWGTLYLAKREDKIIEAYYSVDDAWKKAAEGSKIETANNEAMRRAFDALAVSLGIENKPRF